MAKIATNVDERIFNISLWRGVNEAPEGEARLQFGEAAEMRNFCVTSGGALKKRPGSLNVAGLLSSYAARVREGSRRLVSTERPPRPHEMYPRLLADDVGTVAPAGNGVEVTAGEAKAYEGYYFSHDGAVWRLDECVVTPGEGPEVLGGGRATPGEAQSVESGVEKWTSEGGSVFSGTERLETYPEVTLTDAPRPEAPSAPLAGGLAAQLGGEKTVRSAPAGTQEGFETEDVGGYFVRDGVLYRYYGAKVDAYRPSFSWKKYRCGVDVEEETYYAARFETLFGTSISGRDTVGGYEDYRFNSANGTFTTTGRFINLHGGDSGTIYDGGGSALLEVRVSYNGHATDLDGNPASSVQNYRHVAEGPYTDYNYTYSRGEYVGEVTVPDGQNPEADEGFVYVDSFTDGGTRYTVMRSGQDHYCYAKDDAAGARAYERAYSFYGCPLTVSADTAEWYGSETYSEAIEVTDKAVRGIWSGFVGGREVLCAACGGMLWELKEEAGVWSKVPAGEMDTSEDAHMFGFDEKLYILDGKKYLVWDGERLGEVEGYRPLVSVSAVPEGGGTLLEGVNRLTAAKRCRFSPDGKATVFRLPEQDIASVDWVRTVADGQDVEGATPDLAAGTVTFASAPEKGINTIEIAWTGKEDARGQVSAMRFAETYNGAQDTRVFLYGDGSNRALYSGLDYDGRPRADYFPDLYEVAVGDANTPITAMIRHYNKLMAFKLDSAWSIGYDTITLVDGTVTAGFYVAPVNRSIGNCAYGQAQLVQNRPRTLDGRSVIEWKATSSSGITGDQRNAERVSQRVDVSIRRFDLAKARTFYDKYSHEYYVIGEDGTAIAQNLDVDAWYVYTGLDATCMINYRDELYYGTRDGYLRHFSDEYASDNGAAIDAYWESGAMSFSEDFRRKYSAMVWIGLKPEDNGYLEVTAQTDRKSEFAVYDVQSACAAGVPEMERVKLKAKKFTYYKLILRNNTADKVCTVVSADMRVRGTGYVR